MTTAARLFIAMGVFGLAADALYWYSGVNRDYAGIGLLMFFFFACVFVGLMLLSASPANKRRVAVPDTGLPGSAHPERGAANEHGEIHSIGSSPAPVLFSLAAFLILIAAVYHGRHWLALVLGFGLLMFLGAAAVWVRAASAETRARLTLGGAPHHTVAVAPRAAGPATIGPANYFEQVRQALEAGDSSWAADAYAVDAVYYQVGNPPHLGRDDIRAYLNDFAKAHPGLRWTVTRMGSQGDTAMVEWTWSFRGRTGRAANQPGMTVIQTGPGGIVYHRDYL